MTDLGILKQIEKELKCTFEEVENYEILNSVTGKTAWYSVDENNNITGLKIEKFEGEFTDTCLKYIKDLNNLIQLNLRNNQIIDISPLKNLNNLTKLSLRNNKIIDISPLKNLNNLTELYLYKNQIIDISALKNLNNLTKLLLNSNQITDISALKNLKKLNILYLWENQITDISALKNLNKLTKLSLANNKITDISALKELKKLTLLVLNNNKISIFFKEILNLDLPIYFNNETVNNNSKGIYLYNNPIKNIPIEFIKNGQNEILEKENKNLKNSLENEKKNFSEKENEINILKKSLENEKKNFSEKENENKNLKKSLENEKKNFSEKENEIKKLENKNPDNLLKYLKENLSHLSDFSENIQSVNNIAFDEIENLKISLKNTEKNFFEKETENKNLKISLKSEKEKFLNKENEVKNFKVKIIKIFLASSNELKTEREQFEIFINRKNKQLIKDNLFLQLEIWEDFIDAMSKTSLQNEYNKTIKECDIFVSLFCTKVGRYTAEEFETAFEHFKEKEKPLIYTYFKNSNVNLIDIPMEIFKPFKEFQEKLKSLGHFQTNFKGISELKEHFGNQLEKLDLKNL